MISLDLEKELKQKKKDIINISSTEEKLFYCFFKDFQDIFCNHIKKEKLTFREKVIYKLINNENNKLDETEKLVIKQIIKDKNSLEGAVIYSLFYNKKDITDFNLTFLEFFLLKSKFPDVKANFKESPYEKERKPSLSEIAKLILENRKIEKDLILSALKEIKILYDFLILEKALGIN